MAKIRTISNAIAEIKAADPDTAITKHGLRQAVLSGDIPSRRAGTRFLVDLDQVLAYFSGQDIDFSGEADR